eukprot:53300_1
MATQATVCETICQAIGRYYNDLGKPYDVLFSSYCVENGLEDEDAIKEEMEQDVSDCILVEFDAEFPLKEKMTDKARAQFIYNLIHQCMKNPNIQFGASRSIPHLTEQNADLFVLTKKDLEDIRTTYKTQCPALWNNDWEMDEGLLTILSVGKKLEFDYLLHLVDAYNRHRIRNINNDDWKDCTEQQWCDQNAHIATMQNRKIQVKGQSKTYKEVVKGAMTSFSHRVCNKLHLPPMQQINDSLESVVYYVDSALRFIASSIQNAKKYSRGIVPFQVDFCITSGNALNANGDEHSVGDIQKQIDELKEEVKHSRDTWNPAEEGPRPARVFQKLYQIIKSTEKETEEQQYEYLHRKRLIVTIDRRVSKNDEKEDTEDESNEDTEDDIWMYEPPNATDIPRNAVPESYINSSVTCLIPPQRGAKDHFNGDLLTFSFHVKEEDQIKCYLFYCGLVIRFLPEDIKTVLPKIFNMEYPGNQEFVDGKTEKHSDDKVDDVIARMSKRLVDTKFNEFMTYYT